MSIRRMGFSVALLMLALGLALPASADSQARIVRLSSLDGKVEIDRNTGNGFEKALLNMPVTEGMVLATRDGKAEVEFEDGSTVRLTPDATLDFKVLSLRDSGERVTTVRLEQGLAYFNIADPKHQEFTVNFARQEVQLDRAARFRIGMARTEASLAVSKGDVSVRGPQGEVEAGKNRTVNFDLENGEQYTVAGNYQPDPFDSWDKEQDEYHQRYAANSYNDSPYRYGFSDLNYYGSYYNFPGYGTLWRPYFAGLGWDPFWEGAWMFYPGFGYTWVSAYPWGWLPYRFGNWVYIGGYGWFWQPGYWNSWAVFPGVRNAPRTWVAPRPPVVSTRSAVVVNHGPAVAGSGLGTAPGAGVQTFVRSDDAGLGVPRGRMDLSKVAGARPQIQGLRPVPRSMGVAEATSGAARESWRHGGTSSPGSGRPMSAGGSTSRVSSAPRPAPRMSAPAARPAPAPRSSSPHR